MRHNRFFGWMFVLTLVVSIFLAVVYYSVPETPEMFISKEDIGNFSCLFLGATFFSLFLLWLGMPRRKFSVVNLIAVMSEMGIDSDSSEKLEHLINRVSPTEACAIAAFAGVMGFKIPENLSALENRANGGRKTIMAYPVDRYHKTVGLQELDKLAREIYGKEFRELTESQLILIMKVINVLNIPVTAQSELENNISDAERRLRNQRYRAGEETKNLSEISSNIVKLEREMKKDGEALNKLKNATPKD